MYNWVAHPTYKNQNRLCRLYETTFFTLLATEDTCAVRVAYIVTYVGSFYGKYVCSIRKGRMSVL